MNIYSNFAKTRSIEREELNLNDNYINTFAYEFAQENLEGKELEKFNEKVEDGYFPKYILSELTGNGVSPENLTTENKEWQEKIASAICEFVKDFSIDPYELQELGEEWYMEGILEPTSAINMLVYAISTGSEEKDLELMGNLVLGIEDGVITFFEDEYSGPTIEEVEQGIYTNDFMTYLGYNSGANYVDYLIGLDFEKLSTDYCTKNEYEELKDNGALPVIEKYAPKFAEELKEEYEEKEMEY